MDNIPGENKIIEKEAIEAVMDEKVNDVDNYIEEESSQPEEIIEEEVDELEYRDSETDEMEHKLILSDLKADIEEIRKTSKDYIPGVNILAGEEGSFSEVEEGSLELKKVKEIIIRAFKEDESGKLSPLPAEKLHKKEPRIFMRDENLDEEEEIQEEALAAAVKVFEGEIKARIDESEKVIESSESGENHETVGEQIKEKSGLANAELILVPSPDYALALSYTPGEIPRLMEKGKKKKAHKIIDEAFKMDIPVVEVVKWNYHAFNSMEVGEEIPDSMFPVAAKALGLIYRLKSDAHMVRFIKPMKKVRAKKSKKSKEKKAAHEEALTFKRISLDIDPHLYELKQDLHKQLELTSNRLAAELGLPVPEVHVKKNLHLAKGEYILKIKEVPYTNGVLDLTFNSPDIYYPLQKQLREMVYQLGHELLGYNEVEELVGKVKKTIPDLVKFLIPEHLSNGALRFILKGLLREKIPIKDMNTILETIEENITFTGDPELLVEYIRSAFSRFISNAYKDKNGDLNVLLLSAQVERKISDSIRERPNIRWLDLQDDYVLQFLTNLGLELRKIKDLEIPVVILTSPLIRRFIRKITETNFPEIPVVSFSEISPMTPVKTVGVVKMDKE